MHKIFASRNYAFNIFKPINILKDYSHTSSEKFEWSFGIAMILWFHRFNENGWTTITVIPVWSYNNKPFNLWKLKVNFGGITFTILDLELCPLTNWKIAEFCFSYLSLNLNQKLIILYIHSVNDNNTQIKFEFW